MDLRGPFHLLNRPRVQRGLVVSALSISLVALAGCSGSGSGAGDSDSDGSDASPVSQSEEPAPPVSFSVNATKTNGPVKVSKQVIATAADGTLDKVKITYVDDDKGKTKLAGKISSDGSTWTADSLLEPGETYKVRLKGTNADGDTRTERTSFTTEALTLDQQTYASIAPLDGETVGVGMPIIVKFDIPITKKAAVEKHLTVTSTPKVTGTWSWISDTEVHYRPKKYWPAGTKVSVAADINGMPTADGIYGQMDNSADFKIGNAMVSTVDVAKHTMTVRKNGKVLRVLPATTGKAGFETRDGIKVIMEKFPEKRMDAATTGISEDSPEYYDISDVKYAMRVTNSGEFVHAAPWSVGSQGSANVSHGCTGLSTSNAQWLYNLSNRGDVVKFVNSSRTYLEPHNGWTDWNVSYKQFKKGSALS